MPGWCMYELHTTVPIFIVIKGCVTQSNGAIYQCVFMIYYDYTQ